MGGPRLAGAVHKDVGGFQSGLQQRRQRVQQRRAAALGVEVQVPRQVEDPLLHRQLHHGDDRHPNADRAAHDKGDDEKAQLENWTDQQAGFEQYVQKDEILRN